MMGCNGCELWTPQQRSCYAGVLHERWAGSKGWPKAFDKPEVFIDRLRYLKSWSDLRGTVRPDRPWLDGYPRMIFLNDLGDPFTESLPVSWLDPVVEAVEASRHVCIMLTKRAARMVSYFKDRGSIPRNLWLCVSVTGSSSWVRAQKLHELKQLFPDVVMGLSIEPLVDQPGSSVESAMALAAGFDWLKIGGESRQGSTPGRPFFTEWLDWFRQRMPPTTSVFVKQVGDNPVVGGTVDKEMTDSTGHGGDWQKWPERYRIREVPVPFRGRV